MMKPQKLLVEISKLWTEPTKIGHIFGNIQFYQKKILKIKLVSWSKCSRILFYLTCLLLALYPSSSNSYISHNISFHFFYFLYVLFSEKMLINNVSINSFMPNLNKKYLTISNTYILLCWNNYYTICHQIRWPLYQS